MMNCSPIKPLLFCIGGLPGTGKTTAGMALLPHLGQEAILVCPDRTMLRLLGRGEGDAIESADLTPALVARAVADMALQTRHALDLGRSVVVPSAFIRQDMRRLFEKLAMEAGAAFGAAWLEAPVSTLHDRARNRQAARNGPAPAFNNASAVGPEHIRADLIDGPITWERVQADQSPDRVLLDILKLLPKPVRGRGPAPHTP